MVWRLQAIYLGEPSLGKSSIKNSPESRRALPSNKMSANYHRALLTAKGDKMIPRYFVVLLLLTSLAVAQQGEQLILISPLIGDTLDLKENTQYSVFPSIPGFQWAVFLQWNDSAAIARICTGRWERGQVVFQYDTVQIEDLHLLQKRIDQRSLLKRGATVDIFLKNGGFERGELIALRDSAFVLVTNEGRQNHPLYDRSEGALVIPMSEAVRVVRKGSSFRSSPVVTGGLLGRALGAALGFGEGTHEETRTGFFGGKRQVTVFAEQNVRIGIFHNGILGALIGGAYGLIVGGDDEILPERWTDATPLKPYVRQVYSMQPQQRIIP